MCQSLDHFCRKIELAGEMTEMPLISLDQSGLPIETGCAQPAQVTSCILVPVDPHHDDMGDRR
jgi:hypothetical protein